MCFFNYFILLYFLAAAVTEHSVAGNNNYLAKSEISNGFVITIDVPSNTTNDLVYYNELTLPAYSINTIKVGNLDQIDFEFAIIQSHSCYYNVTLSHNRTIEEEFHQSGADIGLTFFANQLDDSINQIFYLFNLQYHRAVDVSIALILYRVKGTPIPGGCSNEGENVPSLIVQSNKDFLYVDTPLAADETDDCDSYDLVYTSYHKYLQRGETSCRTYFDGIKQFLTIEQIRQNGSLGSSNHIRPNRRTTYSSVPGTGIVFGTIVRMKNSSTLAAGYVPAFSISCQPNIWESNCDIFQSAQFRILIATLIFVGVVRSYVGQSMHMFGIFIDGFVVGTFVTYFTIYYLDFKIEQETEKIVFYACGTVCASILTIIVMLCPPLTFLFEVTTGLIVGYLLWAVSDFLIVDNQYKELSYWYELTLVVSILVVFVILPPCYFWSGTILSITWGTFALVQAIGFVFGTHSSFLIIHSLRRISTPEYRHVQLPPLNDEDLYLLIVWIGLFVSALMIRVHYGDKRHLNQSIIVVADERQPLITRWTRGSDDVFEETNVHVVTNYSR